MLNRFLALMKLYQYMYAVYGQFLADSIYYKGIYPGVSFMDAIYFLVNLSTTILNDNNA